MNTVMIPGLQQEAVFSLTSWSTVSFSTTNLLHADYITDVPQRPRLHRNMSFVMVYVLDQYLKSLVHLFLGAFAKLRKGTITLVMECPSIRLSTCLHGTSQLLLDGLSILYTWVFSENLSRKFKFHWNQIRVMGTSDKVLCTLMVESGSSLFRIRNVLNKSCTENQETNFLFNNFFLKIMTFMRQCRETNVDRFIKLNRLYTTYK